MGAAIFLNRILGSNRTMPVELLKVNKIGVHSLKWSLNSCRERKSFGDILFILTMHF